MCEMTSSRRCFVRWRGKRTVVVSLEQDRQLHGPTKSDVANLAIGGLADAREALQFEGWLVAEQNLWRVLDGSPSGIDELLQEDLSEYPVCFFPEDGREDDCDSIVASLDVYRFLLAVVYGTCLSTLGDTLRRRFGRVLGSLFLKLVELVEGLLEGCSHGVALEEGYAPDQIVLALCSSSALPPAKHAIGRTLVLGQTLQIYLHREVVARLWADNVGPILALQHRLRAVLHQLLVALYAQGYEYLGLALRCRDVECDAIEVRHDLVNVRCSSSVRR
jgi:hypothetical protein